MLFPEFDLWADHVTPWDDRMMLAHEGTVVLGHFVRAFFPAYIPGRRAHYGSVVYGKDPAMCTEVFDLAWRVNELRQNHRPPPQGTEIVASSIRNDQSSFPRIELPPALGVEKGRFVANLCIHRSRLPLGYIHSRLVPLLICPDKTHWSCLLPRRFWSPRMVEVWKSGPPVYPREAFAAQCRYMRVKP